ncbi:hypothetical protein C8R44DRAFT_770837 [Mycena epipterygia]|nr:hypothetical protein C8R44DRAFT_770837 [Mycena epipterygia]
MVLFFPLDKSAIISTSLEAILYGFSALMFIGTLWILLRGRRSAEVNWLMVTLASLLFIVSSIRVVVDIKRLYTGFILEHDKFPGGPAAWFGDVTDPSFILKNVLYGLQTLIGDGVVIYRCYVVWRSFWMIVFPLVVYGGLFASVVGTLIAFATTTSGGIFITRTESWVTSFYSLTLSCNLISTALLAYRLWSVSHKSNRGATRGGGLTFQVLMVVIDAGALYSLTLCAALISFALKSNGQFVVVDMITPIISIAFYLIILRIGIASQKDLERGTSSSRVTNPRMPVPRNTVADGPFKPMHVHIQVDQLTEREGLEVMDKGDYEERMDSRSTARY